MGDGEGHVRGIVRVVEDVVGPDVPEELSGEAK
jgi:hypothetical protein